MKKVKFNINDYVWVKITPEGRKIMNDRLAKLSRFSPVSLKPLEISVDRSGFTKFQLWDLMSIFGEHIYNGCNVPFETDIRFSSKDIK